MPRSACATTASTGASGYRILDTKFEAGEGSDRFEYDVLYQGPAVGFAINL